MKNKINHKIESLSPKRYNKLPHIDVRDYYQFITFRTHDSVDEFLFKIRDENISNSKKEYKIDQYLDQSSNGCYLNDEVVKFLFDYFRNNDQNFYDLVSFCIMPNHIHILFKQNIELSKIMKQIKGTTSFKINKILERKGRFWENNYYDKVIRDEKHFIRTYEYIKNNPIKAGLKDLENRFYGIFE